MRLCAGGNWSSFSSSNMAGEWEWAARRLPHKGGGTCRRLPLLFLRVRVSPTALSRPWRSSAPRSGSGSGSPGFSWGARGPPLPLRRGEGSSGSRSRGSDRDLDLNPGDSPLTYGKPLLGRALPGCSLGTGTARLLPRPFSLVILKHLLFFLTSVPPCSLATQIAP